MKNVFNLLLVAFVTLTFSSCQDKIKNCVEDITGTYTGTQDCGSGTENISFTITTSSDGDDKILFNFNGDIIKATVNEDCDYSLESTVLIDQYNNAITFTGAGAFDAGDIDGTLIATSGGLGVTCTMNVSKQ